LSIDNYFVPVKKFSSSLLSIFNRLSTVILDIVYNVLSIIFNYDVIRCRCTSLVSVLFLSNVFVLYLPYNDSFVVGFVVESLRDVYYKYVNTVIMLSLISVNLNNLES
jgi:hypothetical protein